MTMSLRRFVALVVAIAPRPVATSLVLMILAAATEGVGILMLAPLLEMSGVMGDASGGVWAPSARYLPHSLGPLLALYVAVVSARAALEHAESVAVIRVDAEVTRTLRERIYRALVRARWEAVVPLRGSRLTHVLTAELERVSLATSQSLRGMLELAIATTYAGAAFLIAPRIALVAAAGGALLLAVAWRQQRAARRDGDAISAIGAELFAGATEEVATLKMARSAGIGETVADRFSARARDYADALVAAHRRFRTAAALVSAASAAALAIVVYSAVVGMRLAPASLLLLLFVCARLIPRLTSVQSALLLTVRAIPAAEAVLALLAELETAAESRTGHASAPLRLAREVELRGVSYRYPGASTSAVRDVSVRIPAGEVTSLVGPSGAGKSTLADLVLLLLEPTEGQILVDGVPLDHGSPDGWRDLVAYVPQDSYLFHDSVRENVRWVRPGASDDDVREALRLAGATPLLERLSHGLDTMIGDRGALLSGGERQRLALARALLRRPRFLVLDEATSALDPESEQSIRHTIAALTPSVTVLAITHRLTSARHADQVLVLEDGELIASGRWAEVMERGDSRLAALWAAQVGEPSEGVAAGTGRSS